MTKLGKVRARRKINPDFRLMHSLVVILRDSLSDFHRRCADNRIEIGVVVGLAAKNLYSKSSLFDVAGVPLERSFHYVAKEVGISFAVLKKRTAEDAFQLLPDRPPFRFCFRHPDITR